MLSDLRFSHSYASEQKDISAELYLPCMREADAYDRITGFFSSTVLAVAWPALRLFVEENCGKMRILCSPRLRESDTEGIVSGYAARTEKELARKLRKELDELLAAPSLSKPARLLTALIAGQHVDVRLALVTPGADASSRRMFHDKVGIFRDRSGNRVGFRGTFNDTYLGLSPTGNVESVDVWTSWEGGKDVARLDEAVERFESLWRGERNGVDVLDLPSTTLEHFKRIASEVDTHALLAELEASPLPRTGMKQEAWQVGHLTLREHQRRAVKRWRENDHRGLLAHATGSGKTATALYCVHDALEQGQRPVVVVPSALLLGQWADNVHELLGCRTILCGGGHDRWRGGLLATAVEDGTKPRVVIAVANTAASPEFTSQIRRSSDRVLLVADEVHRLGSQVFRQILREVPAKQRLGLSATPERAGDSEGTALLVDYFGGIVDEYGIKNALDDGVLTPYEFFPEFVYLNDDENETFSRLTRKVKRQAAIASAPSASTASHEHLKWLLIERSRVIKNAAAKPDKAATIIADRYRPGHRWLVYCDNQIQVAEVQRQLRGRGVESWAYYRGMLGDPQNTLRAFETNGGVVVSIRCLDEGVDIPASDHALILASSRNPREHIQRRGRVLRRQAMKTVATLVDVLTLPRTVDTDDTTVATVTGEMARAAEFASWSLTRTAMARIREVWVDLGLNLQDLPRSRDGGIEDDVDLDEVTL